MMPDDYKIPDDPDTGRYDAAQLRTCFGLSAKPGEAPPQLPDTVRRAYYDMSRALSLLGAKGAIMTSTQLAIIVVLARRDSGLELPPEEPPDTSFMRWYSKQGRVMSGEKVVVHWQMKDQPAHFIEVDGNRLKLLVKGNEVRFRPDLVRCVKEGEFPDVPDNINQPAGA